MELGLGLRSSSAIAPIRGAIRAVGCSGPDLPPMASGCRRRGLGYSGNWSSSLVAPRFPCCRGARERCQSQQATPKLMQDDRLLTAGFATGRRQATVTCSKGRLPATLRSVLEHKQDQEKTVRGRGRFSVRNQSSRPPRISVKGGRRRRMRRKTIEGRSTAQHARKHAQP